MPGTLAQCAPVPKALGKVRRHVSLQCGQLAGAGALVNLQLCNGCTGLTCAGPNAIGVNVNAQVSILCELKGCGCQGAPPVRGLQPRRRMVRAPVRAPSWTQRPPAWRAHPRGPAPESEPAAWAVAAWLCILQSIPCCQPHRVSWRWLLSRGGTFESSASARISRSSLSEHPAGQTLCRQSST